MVYRRETAIKTGCSVEGRGDWLFFKSEGFLAHPRNIATTPFFRHLNVSEGALDFLGIRNFQPLPFSASIFFIGSPKVPISSLNDSQPHPRKKLELLSLSLSLLFREFFFSSSVHVRQKGKPNAIRYFSILWGTK